MDAFEWAENKLDARTPDQLQDAGVNVYFAPECWMSWELPDISPQRRIAPGGKVLPHQRLHLHMVEWNRRIDRNRATSWLVGISGETASVARRSCCGVGSGLPVLTLDRRADRMDSGVHPGSALRTSDTHRRCGPSVDAAAADGGGGQSHSVPPTPVGGVGTRVVCVPANRTWLESRITVCHTPSTGADPLSGTMTRNASRNARSRRWLGTGSRRVLRSHSLVEGDPQRPRQ